MATKTEDDQHTHDDYNVQMEPEVILFEPDGENKASKTEPSDDESEASFSDAEIRKRSLRRKRKHTNYDEDDSTVKMSYKEDSDFDEDDDDRTNWAQEILRQALYEGPPKRRKRGRPRGYRVRRISDDDLSQKKGKCIFSDEEEVELVDYIRGMEDIIYGITAQAVRQLAYEFADRLRLQHNFNHDRRMAGVDWCRGFMKRHPDIGSKRVDGPGGTGYTDAPTREAVDQFYDRVERALKDHQIPSDRVFNVDESGIACVSDGTKMFANRARRRIGRTSNVERGTTCTTICCMGATGAFVSPMLIFKRHKCGPGLMQGAPANFVARKSHNGWMTEALLLEWLQHFQKETGSSPTHKTLLISDHHSTHVSLQVYDFVRTHGIIMVPVPPHSNHLLNPLDINFFKSMQLNFQKEIQHWLNTHPSQTVQSADIAGIFTAAYMKTVRVDLAVYAFRAAGIVPFNRDAYPKDGGPHPPPNYLLPATQTFPEYPTMVPGPNYIDPSAYKIPHPLENPFINDNLMTAASHHYKRVKYDFHQNPQVS